MKKLILVICLSSIILAGCSNPISSAVEKEGDKTRAEMQLELDLAKQQIDNNIASLSAEIGTDIERTQSMIELFYKVYVGGVYR